MCKQRPCKCSIDLVKTMEAHFWREGIPVPGLFHIGWCFIEGGPRWRQLWVVLPCEGGELHGIPIKGPGSDPPADRATWNWDGNEDKPTLTPSILTWRSKDVNKPDTPDNREEVWHGFITNGRAVSC